MGYLARWNELSSLQRRTLLRAWPLLPGVWLALRTLGLPRTQALLLGRSPGERRAPALQLADLQAMGEAVNIAARHPPLPAPCLTSSLVLLWLLRRQGVAARLRIGVRFHAPAAPGRLDAHAWVEWQGVPLNDRSDVGAQFAAFDDLPPLQAFETP
jgi:hypothetical protein